MKEQQPVVTRQTGKRTLELLEGRLRQTGPSTFRRSRMNRRTSSSSYRVERFPRTILVRCPLLARALTLRVVVPSSSATSFGFRSLGIAGSEGEGGVLSVWEDWAIWTT